MNTEMARLLKTYVNALPWFAEPTMRTLLIKHEMNLLDKEILIYQQKKKQGDSFNEKEFIKRMSAQRKKRNDGRMWKTSPFKKEFRYITHLENIDPDKPIKFNV